jgi:RNA polymerase sigma factor (sigma-70 family)
MAESAPSPKHRLRKPYVMAVVLGTALSAFGPSQGVIGQTPEETLRAINDMNRYCTTCWRNARLPLDAWGDCTQEVFSRMLQRVPTADWDQVLAAEGDERREFLRAIDAVKKRTQRARKYSGAVEALADRRDQLASHLAEQREAVRQAAAELLSARQQRILQLSLEGWSVQEMADELGLPAERVSDEKYKAIRKLRAHLCEEERSASGLPA